MQFPELHRFRYISSTLIRSQINNQNVISCSIIIYKFLCWFSSDTHIFIIKYVLENFAILILINNGDNRVHVKTLNKTLKMEMKWNHNLSKSKVFTEKSYSALTYLEGLLQLYFILTQQLSWSIFIVINERKCATDLVRIYLFWNVIWIGEFCYLMIISICHFLSNGNIRAIFQIS